MLARSKTGSGLLRFALAAAILVGLAVVLLPSLNPFGTDRIDRTQPAVLKAIEDLGELRSSSANLQVVVDLEEDAKLVPDFLKGERVLFIAGGRVDGSVDLSKLKGDDVKVSDDRRSVELILPRATLGEAQIDPARTRVVDRDRGLIDRLGDVVSDNPSGEQELYLLAQRRLEAAAAADPEVLKRAEENTEATLGGLLRALGFTDVKITFAGEKPGV